MIQDNILYQDLIDDITDRLQHLVGKAITEQDRQLLLAPERMARAGTEALLRFCRVAEASAIPDLVTEVTLTNERAFRNIASYKFPEATFSEREDNGILSVIIAGEELAWEETSTMESVIFRANNTLYGSCEPCFNYDDLKKRLYTPCEVSVALLIVLIPHNIRSSVNDAGVGNLLTVTGAPSVSEDLTISDGTNSVTVAVLASDTVADVATKIITAINAATTFYFDVYATSQTDEIQFNIKPSAPLNGNVELTIDVGTTGATASTSDTGTYILPVGVSYQDEIAELMLRQLLSLDLGGERKVPVEEQPAQQT